MRVWFISKKRPDLPMHGWIMALKIVKIAIIQLVNTIELPFTI